MWKIDDFLVRIGSHEASWGLGEWEPRGIVALRCIAVAAIRGERRAEQAAMSAGWRRGKGGAERGLWGGELGKTRVWEESLAWALSGEGGLLPIG